MLHLHFSNRFEVLRDALVQRLRDEPLASVFEVQTVIVPGAAVQRALTLALADGLGVCAQVRFAFLGQWLWQQIARLVPGVAEASPFAPGVMAWRLYDALADDAFTAPHPRLAGWLAEADAPMRWELAREVASLFDQLLTYRPHWLAAWEQGQRVLPAGDEAAADEAWQAALWQRLAAALGLTPAHPADVFLQALHRLGEQGPEALAAAGLPQRVHLVALPAMPPLYLKLLAGLGRWMDLHLHVLNPCREYWVELVDGRLLARLRAQGRDQGHEIGHRLLAGWGRQTQSQLALLIDAAGDAALDDGDFREATAPTLLAHLQNSLLDLQEPDPGEWALEPGDRSIELHVCHSLTRELEVLHDRLLALFAAHPGLQPADVLVVTPDLEAAAPLIEAVFGTVPPQRRLPFALSGRARSRLNPAAQALLSLLDSAGGRWPVTEVMGLLRQPLVARRFGLDDDALQQLHDALQAAGVHWGLDGTQRRVLGLDIGRHALEDGLDRLLLGHALPGNRLPEAPLAGLLPAGDTEGQRALALGALWQFNQRLQALAALAATPLPAVDWPRRLAALVDDFLLPADGDADDLRELQAAIGGLDAQLQQAALAMPLPLSVVRAALEQQLDDPARGGVPTGAITFSGMTPLRGLPCAVVCVIGLDDDAYPGRQRPPEFDLMARQPQMGDRQRRLDDRNVFLDLVGAARSHLHLSHSGRSVRDNQPRPPSVLVAELLDFLLPAIAVPGMTPAQARAQLVVEHPLQPFALDAFLPGTDPRQRSHAEELAQALRGALRRGEAPVATTSHQEDEEEEEDDESDHAPLAPFFTRPLPPPGPHEREVALPRLIAFFTHPARALLQQRLQIELPREAELLDDAEPLRGDGLATYQLGQRLLPALIEGRDARAVAALAAAGTELPAGALGDAQRARALAQWQPLAQRVAAACAVPADAPRTFSLDIDLGGEPWRLHGALPGCRAGGLLHWRAGQARPIDRLALWLQHLVLCALAAPGEAPRSRLLALDGDGAFAPVADAHATLAPLLELYRQGLQSPLHFFPRSAWAWWQADRQLAAARRTWHGGFGQPGEGDDPAWRLALRGVADPLDAEFERCAEAVVAPLCAALEDPA